jgi:hypothetical protein
MKKISTLFEKDPNDLSRVINSIDSDNSWALTEGIPTRKFDGTSCAVINGELYKRYDAKKGKTAPEGAIPCQEADPITGHHPHWVKCTEQDKWHWEAFYNSPLSSDKTMPDGTYELCGPKVNGNPEHFASHVLVPHGIHVLHELDILMTVYDTPELLFAGLKSYLQEADIEGIVFHHKDGRMCKIRKCDFGIKR